MSMTAKIISAALLVSNAIIPTQMTTAQKDNTNINTKTNTKEVVDLSKPQLKEEFGQVINVYTYSYLNFRTGPGLNYRVQGKLRLGMTFEIISKVGDWYKIKYNNVTGYVYKDFVQTYTDNAPNPLYQAPKVQPKAKVESEKANHIEKKENVAIKTKAIKHNESNNVTKKEHHWRKVRVELTAYDNSYASSGNWGSLTAMGTRTRVGVVAAPSNIKLGTKVKIPALEWYKSDGVFSVEDRGGAVVQKANGDYVIDVWFPEGTNLDKFGRQYTYMYIMD